MKQNITIKQWNELSNIQKEKMKLWQIKNNWDLSGEADMIINIGQMIEFLYSKKTINNFHTLDNCMVSNKYKGWHLVYNRSTIEKDELCNALWIAVKKELDK